MTTRWTTTQSMVLRAEAILPGWGVRAIRRVIRWFKEYPLAMFRPAWARPGAPGRFFTFRGKQYRYFYHRYNQTWKNERAVEIPIARELVQEYRGRSILEVGSTRISSGSPLKATSRSKNSTASSARASTTSGSRSTRTPPGRRLWAGR